MRTVYNILIGRIQYTIFLEEEYSIKYFYEKNTVYDGRIRQIQYTIFYSYEGNTVFNILIRRI